jgi:hypothetical protein
VSHFWYQCWPDLKRCSLVHRICATKTDPFCSAYLHKCYINNINYQNSQNKGSSLCPWTTPDPFVKCNSAQFSPIQWCCSINTRLINGSVGVKRTYNNVLKGHTTLAAPKFDQLSVAIALSAPTVITLRPVSHAYWLSADKSLSNWRVNYFSLQKSRTFYRLFSCRLLVANYRNSFIWHNCWLLLNTSPCPFVSFMMINWIFRMGFWL